MTNAFRTHLIHALPWAALALACVVIFALGWSDVLRFDRPDITSGAWWQLFSAHLAHLSWPHLWMNLAALALTAYVSAQSHSLGHFFSVWILLLLGTGAGLYWFAPDLIRYVGLSGALHGALIVYISDSPFYDRRIRALVVIVILAKVGWEQSPWFDDMANADSIGGRTEGRAHLYGALTGVLIITMIYCWSQMIRLKKQVDKTT